MKTLKIIAAVFLLSSISCKNQEKKAKDETDETTTAYDMGTAKTYAEISIAEGGQWEGRVYENGTSFKNVEDLKVPASHTDHSWYVRYEGPGWESNKIGYRLYIDWRNAIDIYGKVTDSLILNQVGQDGFDSYHERQSWGQDVLKVGKGLGVGSLGRYINGEVLHFNEVDSTFVKVANTTNESTVKINYFGWKTAHDKIDLQSILSIKPDSRITKHTIQSSAAVEGICTGIVDHKVNYFAKESENRQWGYIATYGEQTLVPDKLGMAVFYNTASVQEVTNWEHDYLLVFKPTTEEITFFFLGAWEQENGGIKTEAEFLSYLDDKLNELNSNNTLN
ncbi:MAG: DUF4861 family protein [Bacteroidales bacterium]|nr:DUF4861 family protein [Bacteroidales bacterium]